MCYQEHGQINRFVIITPRQNIILIIIIVNINLNIKFTLWLAANYNVN